MLVETFEVEESTDEMALMAADSEGMELIEKLGLEGQKSLSNADTVERFQYRKMTKDEALVYGAVCPKKTPIKSYCDELIPLRVLQVAAHVDATGFCNEGIMVWHPENGDIKDPVLVGLRKVRTGPGEYSYNIEQYRLARWGAELPSFDELRTMAKKFWIGSTRAKLAKCKAEIEASERTIDALEKFDGIPNIAADPVFYFHL